jgi:hypothetical protein
LKESEGEWKVQVREGAATLALTSETGEDYYRIEKVTQGVLKLNGRDRAWTTL